MTTDWDRLGEGREIIDPFLQYGVCMRTNELPMGSREEVLQV